MATTPLPNRMRTVVPRNSARSSAGSRLFIVSEYPVTMNNRLPAELLAEFLGTTVLILFGNGVVAMEVLFNKGGYTNITLAWGLAVTMGIYIAGKITGAHLNPAVTLTLAVFRGFSWRKVLPYS